MNYGIYDGFAVDLMRDRRADALASRSRKRILHVLNAANPEAGAAEGPSQLPPWKNKEDDGHKSQLAAVVW